MRGGVTRVPVHPILFRRCYGSETSSESSHYDRLVMTAGQHLLHVMRRSDGTAERVDRQPQRRGDALPLSALRDMTCSTYDFTSPGLLRFPLSFLPMHPKSVERMHVERRNACTLLVWATHSVPSETTRMATTAARRENVGVCYAHGHSSISNREFSKAKELKSGKSREVVPAARRIWLRYKMHEYRLTRFGAGGDRQVMCGKYRLQSEA